MCATLQIGICTASVRSSSQHAPTLAYKGHSWWTLVHVFSLSSRTAKVHVASWLVLLVPPIAVLFVLFEPDHGRRGFDEAHKLCVRMHERTMTAPQW